MANPIDDAFVDPCEINGRLRGEVGKAKEGEAEVMRRKLRCRQGDVVRVVASTNPALIGAVALVQRLRSDGRWNVLVDRVAHGVTMFSGRAVLTREFCFSDESLEPLGNLDDFSGAG